MKIQAIKRNGEVGKPTAIVKDGKIESLSLNATFGQSMRGLSALAKRMREGFEKNDMTKFKVIEE